MSETPRIQLTRRRGDSWSIPFLTERGRVEVDLALARLQVARQQQQIAELEAENAQLREQLTA